MSRTCSRWLNIIREGKKGVEEEIVVVVVVVLVQLVVVVVVVVVQLVVASVFCFVFCFFGVFCVCVFLAQECDSTASEAYSI